MHPNPPRRRTAPRPPHNPKRTEEGCGDAACGHRHVHPMQKRTLIGCEGVGLRGLSGHGRDAGHASLHFPARTPTETPIRLLTEEGLGLRATQCRLGRHGAEFAQALLDLPGCSHQVREKQPSKAPGRTGLEWRDGL
ncbi:hypothetical protein F751_2245 [Auxenochlorella protothecoides]|uniref:Uncharacterized protein n=1 Tax=Auxenochlorella protothecoides TaxID=3075 RepID=A0A087SMN5_AUXPR|nr:hypothetical protein F751_2245 [Auxenochlorella protothecoides]KFM26989.1 hypothetical protein F751_2245 [Auxenochlorella protothecoides]